LIEWLRIRLEKGLPIDNWHRKELEELLKNLKQSQSETTVMYSDSNLRASLGH
jgi:hypothetical protein